VILITGAGGQLGAALAAEVIRRGAAVALIDTDAKSLAAVRESSRVGRVPVVSAVINITREAEIHDFVVRVESELGPITGCVNNAGIEGPIVPVEELNIPDVLQLFDVNVFGMLRVAKAILPFMKERRRGRVVNIASGAGLFGSEYMSAYSSSKHAVIGLTRSMARELATWGIAVNAVCPGPIDSPMMTRIERRLAEITGAPMSFIESIPARRYAGVGEIADLSVYLALDSPQYLTGAAIPIDGGLHA
jgi:NAD(P)-dependent dehydrogenase (short-subunit alcohol dehydrogenase family)